MLTTAETDDNADSTGADRATFKIADANFMCQLLLYQQKIMQNYRNY